MAVLFILNHIRPISIYLV